MLQFEKEEIASPGVKAGGLSLCSYKGMVNCPVLQGGRQTVQPLAGNGERISPRCLALLLSSLMCDVAMQEFVFCPIAGRFRLIVTTTHFQNAPVFKCLFFLQIMSGVDVACVPRISYKCKFYHINANNPN